jgi:hypothetical protein
MVETEIANTFAISACGMPCLAARIILSLRSVEYAFLVPAYSPLNTSANRCNINAQEDFSLKINGNTLAIAACGLEKDFEHSMIFGLDQVEHLWLVMIDPALQCVDRRHHMVLLDALAFVFMAIEQVRGDSVGTQIVNFLIGKSSS